MKKRAFTMVELIFVIVILGILAAVAVPRLNASREDAKLAKYVSDVVTIMRDARSYHAANGLIYQLRSVEDPGFENDCKILIKDLPTSLATWDGKVCTWRKNLNLGEPIDHITNVQLESNGDWSWLLVDSEYCIGFAAGRFGSDTVKLGDENYFSARTLFRPDADASGKNALCKRLLAHPAVLAALTNENGDTLGVRGFDPHSADHTSTACQEELTASCAIEFNFAASGVDFD